MPFLREILTQPEIYRTQSSPSSDGESQVDQPKDHAPLQSIEGKKPTAITAFFLCIYFLDIHIYLVHIHNVNHHHVQHHLIRYHSQRFLDRVLVSHPSLATETSLKS